MLDTRLKAGQPIWHKPIYAMPKISALDRCINEIFGRPDPQPKLLGYQPVKLNWKHPTFNQRLRIKALNFIYYTKMFLRRIGVA